jgi:hypothetical protein
MAPAIEEKGEGAERKRRAEPQKRATDKRELTNVKN